MKKLSEKIFTAAAVFSGVLLAALVIVSMNQDALAVIEQRQAAPSLWYDQTGTNAIGFSTNATMTVRAGSTIYTGSTTNLPFLRGSGITNTLVIVKGVITGVQ